MDSIPYAVDNDFFPVMKKDENGNIIDVDKEKSAEKREKDGKTEAVHHLIIGYMCHLPVKLTVIDNYTRSVKYSVEYLDYKHEILVYYPTNISPDEAIDRLKNKVGNLLYETKTGDEEFDKLKEFFLKEKGKFYKPINKAFSKFNLITREDKYNNWVEMRNESEDEYGYKICYCGHTNTCECSDPSITLFEESIKNKTLDPLDPKNGWGKIK